MCLVYFMILRFLSLYLTNTNYRVNILSVYHMPDPNALSYWTLVSGPIIILWKGLNDLVKLYHKSDGVGIQTWIWLQSPKPIIQYHLWVSILSLEFWIWLGKEFSGHLFQPLFSYLNHGYDTLSCHLTFERLQWCLLSWHPGLSFSISCSDLL